MDLGSGALGALHRYVDPLSIDAVLLSHLHADHCLDLCGYYVLRKYHPEGPQPRLPVYGPAGTAGRMARAYDLPEDPGMGLEFDFRTWAPGEPARIGPFTVQPIPSSTRSRPTASGSRPAGGWWPTPGTAAGASSSRRWPAAPTSCWPRRPSTRTPTTRPAST